jgi:hypothetical protein
MFRAHTTKKSINRCAVRSVTTSTDAPTQTVITNEARAVKAVDLTVTLSKHWGQGFYDCPWINHLLVGRVGQTSQPMTINTNVWGCRWCPRDKLVCCSLPGVSSWFRCVDDGSMNDDANRSVNHRVQQEDEYSTWNNCVGGIHDLQLPLNTVTFLKIKRA